MISSLILLCKEVSDLSSQFLLHSQFLFISISRIFKISYLSNFKKYDRRRLKEKELGFFFFEFKFSI